MDGVKLTYFFVSCKRFQAFEFLTICLVYWLNLNNLEAIVMLGQCFILYSIEKYYSKIYFQFKF